MVLNFEGKPNNKQKISNKNSLVASSFQKTE